MTPPLSIARLGAALVVSAAFVLSAPYIGGIRSALRSSFPSGFAWIVGGSVASLILLALVVALVRIRVNRGPRYVALGLACAGAAAYEAWHMTGRIETDVVEIFHFVEYGIIAFLFYRYWKPLEDASIVALPILAGLIVGAAEEWLEWFVPVRVGEMADVLLNAVALACGLVFSLGADPPSRFATSLRPGSAARLGRLAAATLVSFAVFFHIVHLGFDLDDDRIGVTFKSRYSMERLAALGDEKVEQWRRHPLPLQIERISREDQYMTEGVTHVQRRNERLAAADAAAAWKENAILEKYFGPVLDTPSYVSRTGHRWGDAQRADVETRAAAAPAAVYASGANPYPIFAWSKAMFWGAIGTAALALLAIGALAERSHRHLH